MAGFKRGRPVQGTPGAAVSAANRLRKAAPEGRHGHSSREGRPVPMGSLQASAQRLVTSKRGGSATLPVQAEGWQDEAWGMFDSVGEEHFLGGTLAAYMGQARLFIGRRPKDPTDDVIPVEGGPADALLDELRGTTGSTNGLMTRFGINLFVTGDCYLVGVPTDGWLAQRAAEEALTVPGAPSKVPAGAPDQIAPNGQPEPGEEVYSVPLDQVEWSCRSISEVKVAQGMVTIDDGTPSTDGSAATGRTYNADDVYLVRIWRSHPRKAWWADSPTKSSLPVLRELVGLTMHISAQVDSRLAGAGLLVFPSEAEDAMKAPADDRPAGAEEYDDAEDSPVMAALMQAMLDPLKDRDSAAAVVPLVVTPPAEYADKIRKIDFSTPLDDTAIELREEAIRRLALGQDCPPELLLGTDSMNHWGAWLVKEDTVTTHLEPPLSIVCDALTTGYLWPLLLQGGMEPEAVEELCVWYDVDHLIIRPNRSQDAKDLHDAGVISDKALRDSAGFNDTDAPEQAQALDLAVQTALDMVKNAPTLAQAPGLPQLVDQIRAVLSGDNTAPADTSSPLEGDDGAPTGDTPADGGPPQVENGPGTGQQGPADGEAE